MKYFYLLICTLAGIPLQAQELALQVQAGHLYGIYAVDVSPDNRFILTTGGILDPRAKIWDLSLQKEWKTFDHGAGLLAARFSRNGRKVYTLGTEGKLKEWDIRTAQLLREYKAHQDYGLDLAIADNGELLATLGAEHELKIWKPGNTTPVKRYPTGVLTEHLDFHPNGRQLVTGDIEGYLSLWDVEQSKAVLRWRAEKAGLAVVKVSPDGQWIISGGDQLQLWKWGEKRSERTFAGISSPIQYLVFAPDSRAFYTLNNEGVIQRWSIDQAAPLATFEGEVGQIPGLLAIDQSGRFLIAGGSKRFPQLWNIQSGKPIPAPGNDAVSVSAVAYHKDQKLLISGGYLGQIHIHDLKKAKVLFSDFNSFTQRISGLAVNHNFIAIADERGKLKVLAAGTFETLAEYDLSESGSRGTMLEFLPDRSEKLLVIRSGDIPRILDLFSGRFTTPAPSLEDITAAAVHPSGAKILFGDQGGNIHLFDFSTAAYTTYPGHQYKINTLAWSPDGQYFASGAGNDPFLKKSELFLWTTDQRRPKKKLEGHDRYITHLAFSPDGSHMASGDGQGVITLWHMPGAETFQKLTIHSAVIDGLAFTADNYLISNSLDGKINLWDTGQDSLALSVVNASADGAACYYQHDGYYKMSKTSSDLVSFVLDEQVFLFEQFDLKYHRPDIIHRILGAEQQTLDLSYKAYLKRLDLYGYQLVNINNRLYSPQCNIDRSAEMTPATRDSIFVLPISVYDSLEKLDRLNVFINDVPVYGIAGIDLRHLNTNTYRGDIKVPLAGGSNKIQVSALNQAAAESLKATLYVNYEAPPKVPDLYLVTIGVSDYQADNKDLDYAAKDARDIAAIYENASGFQKVYTKVLTDDLVTKTNILALRTWLEQSRVDDQVLIYVSGHGLLDGNYDFYYATYDVDFAHPAEKGILYDDIEGLLDGIPARKKLLLMDACHSGEYDQDAPPLTSAQQDSLQQKGIILKGFSKGDADGAPVLGLQNGFEMMQQLFADLRRGSGATVISSSSGVQVSYEDAEWQNGVFTYAFLYGLKSMRADTNQDGQITASEIQAFVAEFVPRLTEGVQVPTFRRENLEFDFRVW